MEKQMRLGKDHPVITTLCMSLTMFPDNWKVREVGARVSLQHDITGMCVAADGPPGLGLFWTRIARMSDKDGDAIKLTLGAKRRVYRLYNKIVTDRFMAAMARRKEREAKEAEQILENWTETPQPEKKINPFISTSHIGNSARMWTAGEITAYQNAACQGLARKLDTDIINSMASNIWKHDVARGLYVSESGDVVTEELMQEMTPYRTITGSN